MSEPPDLSAYSTADPAALEWFCPTIPGPWLSGRAAAYHQSQLEVAAGVRAWAERTRAADAAGDLDNRPPGWRESLTRLAELMGPMADNNQLHTVLEDAEPDDVRVLHESRRHEMHRRVSGTGTTSTPPT